MTNQKERGKKRGSSLTTVGERNAQFLRRSKKSREMEIVKKVRMSRNNNGRIT